MLPILRLRNGRRCDGIDWMVLKKCMYLLGET